LPLIGYYPTAPQLDQGIEPDIAVATTAADIALGRDAIRIAALARMKAV
jgi:hypothetical protein